MTTTVLLKTDANRLRSTTKKQVCYDSLRNFWLSMSPAGLEGFW